MRNLGKYILIIFILFTGVYAKEHKDPFKFTMKAEKKEVYVGEPLKVTFEFTYPIDITIAEANFAPPTFHDFWIKAGKDVPNTIKNGQHTYHLDYIVTPQKAGALEIEPARMDIGVLKSKQRNTLRFDRVKWKSIFSNALHIKVKPLPEGVNLFGHYTIEAKVDKNSTKANEPVNLTVTVKGSGNIEDIDNFQINSDVAAVYADKAKHNVKFKKGKQEAVMTQKFAFIADKDFTIPSFSLTYFDSDAHKVKTVQTQPIPIHVRNSIAKSTTAKLEKKEDLFSPALSNNRFWFIALLGGFAGGVAFTLLWINRKKIFHKPKAQTPLAQRIQKAKSDKALLALLLPYSGKSEKIDAIIKQVEENVYRGAKHPVNRKKLAQNFDEYVTITQNDHDILL